MPSKHITPNHREILYVQDTNTEIPFAVEGDSTTGAIFVEDVSEPTPVVIVNGGKTIAVTGTAVVIALSTSCQAVLVVANSDNTDSVFVGNSTVTNDYDTATSGYELQPGATVGIAINNLNKVYVNGTAADGVSYIGG